MVPPRMARWLLATAAFVAAAAGVVYGLAPGATRAVAATPDKPAPASADDATPPAGVDISKLDDFERKVFFRVVNREASACGRGHSLLYSAKHDPSCRASFYAVRYTAR